MKLTPKQIDTRRQQLLAELAKLDALTPSEPELAAARATELRSKGQRSTRDLVLDALDEIGFMAYTQQLTLYIRARFGREVNPTRFGTLSVDEARAFERGGCRSVWLAHGLTHDRAEPIKRLWGRSDWSLERRLVTPSFGRAQYLRAAARFAELAGRADGFAADPDRLRYLAADLARDLGVVVRHGKFDVDTWKAMAESQLEELSTKETAMVKAAAANWSTKLIPQEQLFGRSGKVIAVPTRTRERRIES